MNSVPRIILAFVFIAAGVNHFVSPGFYIAIMPPYLPWHAELVALSGVVEIALGVLLLFRRTARVAAWGVIALLIAVFPANVHMAMNPQLFSGVSPILLWLRLPLQGVLIAWVYGFTRRPVTRSGG